MRSLTPDEVKQGFTVAAFGLRIHLWSESDVEWHATIHDGEQEMSYRFKEDALPLAKLHILAAARNRAMVRWRDREFPPYENLLDSWKRMTFVDPA